MQDIAYEDLCNKIFRYIRLSDVSLTRDSTLTALQLIEEFLVTESPNVFELVIAGVQERLKLADISLPLICPRVNRSSIGYRDE